MNSINYSCTVLAILDTKSEKKNMYIIMKQMTPG